MQTNNQKEIEQRKKLAIDAIKDVFGTKEDEYSATLFVSHHLEQLEASFWKEHLGTSNPEPKQVLDILVLRSHWSEEDENGIDIFDFTLPEDITNYVICVRFDEEGEVESIEMES